MKLLSVGTVADNLGVSRMTVHRMIKDPNSPLVGYKVNKWVKVSAETAALCMKPIEKRKK